MAQADNRRVLVFFPTYNEAGNVERLIQTIREFLPSAHVLAVDDASADGTGAILDRIAEALPGVAVIHRPGKLGLGSAHKLAMLYARDAGYDVLITMDADFSHHPKYLPSFLDALRTSDFVTGSRYAPGGRSDYGPGRMLLSRTANLLAKVAVGLPLAENTTMYRGFTARLLGQMRIESIHSEGYSFAVESLHHVAELTDRLAELPIHFENRAAGQSKISESEIYKAVLTIQRLGLKRFLPSRVQQATETHAEPVRCCLCGGTHHLEVYPAKNEARGSELLDASPYSCATHSSRSHGQILRCLRCSLIFMKPRLSPGDLVSEYAHSEDPVYLDQIHARETTFRYNLNQVRKYIGSRDRVLEIGSYCGAFLKVAQEEGIDVVGVEPSEWAVRASADVTDAKVIRGTVDDLPDELRRFDVVAAWDVLEHFADPVAELRKINALLPEKGMLLFSTLMIDNWFPRATGKHWPWLMDMHLFYFTEATIRNVLAETGFEIVEDMKYCHIVTFEYLLGKLGTLGIPLAGGMAEAVSSFDWSRTEIPFRFGDIKLFVCRKIDDAPVRSSRRLWSSAAAE
jgi:2-polyprenyl-3-methyl-5-hydroxy-6-metoxy-1,4-benzoquinol methylase